MDKIKKPLYKKWWFWAIIILVLYVIGSTGDDKQKTAEPSQETVQNDAATPETTPDSTPTESPQPEDEPSGTEEYPDKIKGVDISFSQSVNNDVTGNWRLARVATEKEITAYALDYYKAFSKSDDEVHVIVNFTLKTTNVINTLGTNKLSVTVHEYIDKEEHDAAVLGSGEVLAEYQINMKTGKVKQIQ